VLIARANFHVRYPARFQLVAAMNPCRCGYGRASGRNCGKGPNCEEIYQSRISGPLLDRMDLSIELPAVTPADLAAPAAGETTAMVAARVATARAAQAARGPGGNNGKSNAALADADLTAIAAPDADGAALLARAAEALRLSARAYTRIIRVARTLADLDGGDGVKRRHIAEAVSFRRAPDSPAAAPSRSAPMLAQSQAADRLAAGGQRGVFNRR
jgi:magnesium chelatase family protein